MKTQAHFSVHRMHLTVDRRALEVIVRMKGQRTRYFMPLLNVAHFVRTYGTLIRHTRAVREEETRTKAIASRKTAMRRRHIRKWGTRRRASEGT